MKTTLILEDDIAEELQRLRQVRGESLKTLVNKALREGLRHLQTPQGQDRPFRTEAVDLGTCRLHNLDNVAEVLAEIEGEAFR